MNLKENRILQNQFTEVSQQTQVQKTTQPQLTPDSPPGPLRRTLNSLKPDYQELGKHRKIKKLRGRGDWPYQIVTHTIKPLQLK